MSKCLYLSRNKNIDRQCSQNDIENNGWMTKFTGLFMNIIVFFFCNYKVFQINVTKYFSRDLYLCVIFYMKFDLVSRSCRRQQKQTRRIPILFVVSARVTAIYILRKICTKKKPPWATLKLHEVRVHLCCKKKAFDLFYTGCSSSLQDVEYKKTFIFVNNTCFIYRQKL